MLNSTTVYISLVIFTLIMVAIMLIISKKEINSTETFLVSDRDAGSTIGGFSIAATWLWAPAIFISAQVAYNMGLVGFTWFFIPNFTTLIIFGFLSLKLRNMFPEGYTLPEYMRVKYNSNRVHTLYLVQTLIIQVTSVAVQLLAGAALLHFLTGIDYFTLTVLLSIIPLTYSLISGLKASMITDAVQMVFILIVGFTIIPWAVVKAGGIDMVFNGLGGINGNSADFFSKEALYIAAAFGIKSAIGHFSGPAADQMFWQRAFAIKHSEVKKAFVKSAAFFIGVPLMFSLLGFVAVSLVKTQGLVVDNTQLVNAKVIGSFLPEWAILAFTLAAICGLVSTIDSALAAVSSLVSIDIVPRYYGKRLDEKKEMSVNRMSMVILSVLGILIANIPGLTILYLFLFFGTVRAATLIPTILTITNPNIQEKAIFTGILTSLVIGTPIFAYGEYFKILPMALGGTLTTLCASGFLTYVLSMRKGTPIDTGKAI